MPVISFDYSIGNDFLSNFLYYGLLIGAIFQLVCIVSSIVLPPGSELVNEDTESAEETKHNMDNNNGRRLHKIRKQEKKKRR